MNKEDEFFNSFKDPMVLAHNEEIENLKSIRDDMLTALRAECAHDYVVEAPYQTHSFVRDFGELRMCLRCGAEEEKGCGSWKTLIDAPDIRMIIPVTREKIYNLRY